MSPDVFKPAIPIGRRTARSSITVSPGQLCRFEPLADGKSLPWLATPTVPDLNLATWLRNNRTLVADRLREHGALLFRGYGIEDPAQFEECITALSGTLLEYEYRSTPRTRVAGSIYTSTEYPPDRSIPLHNEMSYARAWPLKIWFLSVLPAVSGGETPLADSTKVLARISPRVRATFAARRVMYVRNYGHGIDLPWQEVFQTSARADVERLCRAVGMEFEWQADDRLRTRHVCQSVAAHPDGAQVWFNQAHLFHISSLDQAARELLLDRFDEQDLPRNSYFGDGSRIEESMLDDIRDAYQREMVLFPWQKGDVLLVDNMKVAHGRTPFKGPRRLLAGMAERHGDANLCVEM